MCQGPVLAPLYESSEIWESMQVTVGERLEALLP
jgi:hypothetical protein